MPSKQEKRANKNEQKILQQQEQNKLNEEEMEWEKGTNKRALKKEQQQQEKQIEKMNKVKEVKEMYEKEEQELGTGKKSKSKKNKKDDFSLLQAALASAPKTKSQKLQEEKEKQRHLEIRREQQLKIEKEEKQLLKEKEEKELANKNIVSNDNTFDYDEATYVQSIDDALDQLESDENTKTSFQSFYNKQLAIVKEENPRLRLHQYKEHIFKLWKRSPENPGNQQ